MSSKGKKIARNIRCVVGTDVFQQTVDNEICFSEYVDLLEDLNDGQSINLTQLEFEQLLEREGDIVVFGILAGHVIATAQATLVAVEPNWKAVVNNATTRPGHRGNDYGDAVLNYLKEMVYQQWGQDRKIELRLAYDKKKKSDLNLESWLEDDTTVYFLPDIHFRSRSH